MYLAPLVRSAVAAQARSFLLLFVAMPFLCCIDVGAGYSSEQCRWREVAACKRSPKPRFSRLAGAYTRTVSANQKSVAIRVPPSGHHLRCSAVSIGNPSVRAWQNCQGCHARAGAGRNCRTVRAGKRGRYGSSGRSSRLCYMVRSADDFALWRCLPIRSSLEAPISLSNSLHNSPP